LRALARKSPRYLGGYCAADFQTRSKEAPGDDRKLSLLVLLGFELNAANLEWFKHQGIARRLSPS